MEKQRIRMDQVLQVLFKLSDRMTVHLINGLFDQQFDPKKVKLHYEDNRIISEDFGELRVDSLITIKAANRVYQYHIEFQLSKDNMMMIRMVQYGMKKAMEQMDAVTVNGKQLVEVTFPKQLVMYIERNDQIFDYLYVKMNMPDDQIVHYRIPTIKYWTYSLEQLVEQKLYALIPLYVFRLRMALQQIRRLEYSPEEQARYKKNELLKLETLVNKVLSELRKLMDQNEIVLQELEQMLGVLDYMIRYLYKKFDPSEETIIRRVRTMFESFVDPIKVEKAKKEGKKAGKQEERLQMSKKLFELGMDVDTIKQVTGLTKEELEKLVIRG